MKKLDRRIKRTRRLLGEALVSLALESSYDDVTIKALTQRADVGYATFYRHFKSKDELLTYILLEIVREIKSSIKAELSHYEESLRIFQIFERHKPACLLTLNLPDDHPAWLAVWEDVRKWLIELYTARDETIIPVEVAVNHLFKSCKELARWWVMHGQSYSTEQMALTMSELIIDVIESVALNHRENADNAGPQI